ncbi:hypothetical protein BpHYR1_016193 [Brachionus plicatilis]|uniref:Uncharacterized protein n=1 Tax=Brachionus plicatilis TaxID=10195 RepID=A0A3M7QRG5_BRAPC|nr:hypothetical protein BpHYR1_016193 [Brachionus plicatilis]
MIIPLSHLINIIKSHLLILDKFKIQIENKANFLFQNFKILKFSFDHERSIGTLLPIFIFFNKCFEQSKFLSFKREIFINKKHQAWVNLLMPLFFFDQSEFGLFPPPPLVGLSLTITPGKTPLCYFSKIKTANRPALPKRNRGRLTKEQSQAWSKLVD